MDLIMIFVLVLLELIILQGAHSQKFVAVPRNETVPINSTAFLACRFDAPVTCAWTRSEELLDIGDRFQYVYADPDTARSSDCSIIIKNARLSDVTSYQCYGQATLSSPILTAPPAYLTIRKTPSSPRITKSGREIHELGMGELEETICCKVINGNPAAELYFQIDNMRVTGLNQCVTRLSSINMKELSYDTELCWILKQASKVVLHSHYLRCVGNHPGYNGGVGYVDIALRRNEATSFVRLSHSNGEIVQENETLNSDSNTPIHCNANGYPNPKYRWEFKNSSEESWSRYIADQNITLETEGIYRCKAKNILNENFIYSTEVIVAITVNDSDSRDQNTTNVTNSQTVLVVIALAIVATAIGLVVVFIKIGIRFNKLKKELVAVKTEQETEERPPATTPRIDLLEHTYTEIIPEPETYSYADCLAPRNDRPRHHRNDYANAVAIITRQ